MRPEVAKTHSGLIAAFSVHLVKTGMLPVALGKSINRVEDLRLIADYKGEPVDAAHAAEAVIQAEVFIQAIKIKFFLG